jgi:FHA domain-containing protein
MAYVEFEGDVRPLGPGVLTIGSAPGAGWRILGRGLDPVHLLLSAETGGRALLIRGAAGSAMRVNGVELTVPRALLSFGDRVQAGSAELRYRRMPSGPETSPDAYLRDTRHGRLYRLHDRNTIGRDPGSTVVVQEPDVSRVHAHLVQGGESYVIVPHPACVMSLNGKRLLVPTGLQEGDEIAIGRTLLRFTTVLPSGAKVAPEPAARADKAGREARAATTFMGTIEARDQRSRVTHRRIMRMTTIALIALAMAAVALTVYADVHNPARGVIRTLRPGRRPAGSASSSGASSASSSPSGEASLAASRGRPAPPPPPVSRP